jgi:hypothetical protein
MPPPPIARPRPLTSHQLPLPLPPVDPSPPALPHPLRAVPARRVWGGLSGSARAAVQATLLRIAQEVLDEPAQP